MQDATGLHADQERALEPHADQREQQGEVAEVEEVPRGVGVPVDGDEDGAEGGVGELERQRDGAARPGVLRGGR